MSEDKKHTPLPYYCHPSFGGSPAVLADGKGPTSETDGWTVVAAFHINGIMELSDAEFIVRACNSHYELLELVKNQRAIFDCELIAPDVQTSHSKEFLEAILDRYDRAIAKAEGK